MTLVISITPPSGKIGDLVEITATTGVFTYPEFNKNVVTFNGLAIDIIARIIKSNSNTSLWVIIPPDAITGDVIVETREGESASLNFEVIYKDVLFEQETKPYAKAVINNKVKTVGISEFNAPIYNKDLSYSNFVEIFDENSLLQNVYSIILTQKGERMFSDFGTTIEQKLFSVIDDPDNFKSSLMNEIITAVNTYEPRVVVVEEQSFVIIDGENVNLILALLMPAGNVKELGITLKSVTNVER